MKKLILIGGAPTAGKSHSTKLIANELSLPWISTDTIREQMREIVRKEDYPALFLHAESTSKMGVDFLTKNSVKEIVEVVNKENKDVWKGVKGLIDSDYSYDTLIIEGVAILPKFVYDLSKDKYAPKNIKAIFLIDENIERIRNSIFTRGLWDSAKNYPDKVKEKEVKWVLEFNDYLKRECKKYNFDLVDIGDRKNYLRKIHNLIK